MALRVPLSLLLVFLRSAFASLVAQADGCDAADGQCGAAPDGMSTLQVRGRDPAVPSDDEAEEWWRNRPREGENTPRTAPTNLTGKVTEVEKVACEGPWCDMLVEFCALFDTSDPALIQRGVDLYTDGMKEVRMGLTKHYYYAIEKEKVQSSLAWLLPTGYVSWTSGPVLQQVMLDRGPGVVTIARNGTFTLKLNYFMRKLFWSNYVKPLPPGKNFPYSTVDRFRNSDKAPAIGLIDLKFGGLTGEVEKGWKVIGVTLIKLA